MDLQQLTRAARSSDYRDRVLAARGLAARDDADEALVYDLLLDQEDTAVTYAAADAVLERQTLQAFALFAAALEAAEADTSIWLAESLRAAATDHPKTVVLLNELANGGNAGAGAALAWIRADMDGDPRARANGRIRD